MFMTKKFKSAISILLLLALIFSLVACGKPSAKTFEKAYDGEVDAIVENIYDYYEKLGKYDTSNFSMDGSIGFELSDELLTLLRSYTSYDLEWINDTKITLSENIKGDMMSVAFGLAYDKTDLVAVETIMDYLGGKMFMGVPALSDMYYEQELNGGNSLASLDNIDIQKLLPDKKLVGNLIKDTYGTLMDSLGEPTISEKTLSVSGVDQECVEYKVELSQREFANVILDLLRMLKDNQDLKTIILHVVEAANEMTAEEGIENETTPEEAYGEFLEEINDAIADLEENLQKEGYVTDETAIAWSSYITKKNDVIGIKLDFMDDETVTVYVASAKNKENVGFEFYVEIYGEKIAELKGELVDDGKTHSGSYELKIEGKSMAFIDVECVDAKKLEDGYFIGSITLSPSKGLIDEITGELDGDFSLAGLTVASLSVKIDITENTSDGAKMSVSLMNGQSSYASLLIDFKMSDGKTVKVPENTTTDAEEVVMDFDFDELLTRVKGSGLPDYVAELIEAYAGMLQYQ